MSDSTATGDKTGKDDAPTTEECYLAMMKIRNQPVHVFAIGFGADELPDFSILAAPAGTNGQGGIGYNGLTSPYGGISNAYGTSGYPYGTTGYPYGTSTGYPYSTTGYPYSTTGYPYGTTGYPYGTTGYPYGTTAYPYGTVTTPVTTTGTTTGGR